VTKPRHANKRSPDERRRDRALIAEAYLPGESQLSIARRLNISRQQVGFDLQVIRAAWRESAVRDIGEHMAEELARLDELERTYWRAWEHSRQDLTHTTHETVDDQINVPSGRRHGRVPAPRSRKREATRTEQQGGNPAYLAGVMNCVEMRSKLLGLFPATNVNVTGDLTFGDLLELAQQGERPRLEILAGSGAKPSADHDGNGHHGDDDALLPDGHQ
jgi:hypothetical protein